jgi:hypothetical protein
MKNLNSSLKTIGLSALLAFVSGSALAQAGVDWQLNGNAAASTNFVGTTNAIPLAFRTANVERMRIDATGKVGIGTGFTTLTPTTDFHVMKSANGGSLGTTSVFRLQAINTFASAPGDVSCESRISSDGFYRLTRTITVAGDAESTTSMTVNPNGNIGLAGITNANAKVEISSVARVSALGNTAKFVELSHNGTNGIINSTEDMLVNFTSGRHLALGNIGANSANLTVSGKVGIGVANPAASLDVAGNVKITHTATGSALNVSSSTGPAISLTTTHAAGYSYAMQVGASQPYTKALGVFDNSATPTETFRVYANGRTFINGNVGIGKLEDSGYMLDVAGTIRACEVLVESNGWCDYVFEDNYELRSIDELESYVKENKHLPNIPAASVVESEGQSLGDYQMRMMEKIEELSLYVIELNHGVKDLNQKVQELEAENSQLKAEAQK